MQVKPVLLWSLIMVSLAATAVLGQSRTPAKAPVAGAGPITVRGCISGGREAYTLLQTSTGATFALQGAGAQTLEEIRGKLVEVTGRESPPASTSGMQQLPKLSVKKVRVVGAQCPLRAEGRPDSPVGAPTMVPDEQTAPSSQSAPTAATPRYQSPGAPNQTPPAVGNNPNVGGATGAPSPGTGNAPKPSPPPPPR